MSEETTRVIEARCDGATFSVVHLNGVQRSVSVLELRRILRELGTTEEAIASFVKTLRTPSGVRLAIPPGTSERKPYFEPRIGQNYADNRILIISESTYDWTGEDGVHYTPSALHAVEGVAWHIENFGQNRYFTALNRTLTGEREPTPERMLKAWDEFAYTVFVQSTVGYGPGVRPSSDQWKEAGNHFLDLIERIQPVKAIVTGGDLWANMPGCQVHLVNDLQAYRLTNGELVWCLALPHPANRTEGFKWEQIADRIRLFRATSFPQT